MTKGILVVVPNADEFQYAFRASDLTCFVESANIVSFPEEDNDAELIELAEMVQKEIARIYMYGECHAKVYKPMA